MLTANALKSKARDKPYKLYDGKGLFLLVKPNGLRVWRFKYRYGIKDGPVERGKSKHKEKLLTFGPYNLLSLAEAREKRDAARRLLLDGKDPGAVRLQMRESAAITFKVVALEWLSKQKTSPVTQSKARWLFDSYLFPALGSQPIADIQPTEVLACARRAENAGTHETAHRIRARAGQIFRYAIATGRAQRDPTADLRGALAPVVVKSHAAITDPTKVGALLRAIEGYEGQPTATYALRLLPHLFVRPGELRAAEWQEFDLTAKLWRIPAQRMKMRREHLVPLSKQALKLLEQLHAITGHGRFLFPALANRDRCISENTLNGALRRLGYNTQTEMTSHGFRVLASTLLNERGVNADVIELQLGHKDQDEVRAVYNRAQRMPERKELMQQWSDHLDDLRSAKA